MLKETGRLKDGWFYTITQKDKLITVYYTNGIESYTVEEELEMAGFGINDYSITTLQYMLDNARGLIKDTNKFNPTKY